MHLLHNLRGSGPPTAIYFQLDLYIQLAVPSTRTKYCDRSFAIGSKDLVSARWAACSRRFTDCVQKQTENLSVRYHTTASEPLQHHFFALLLANLRYINIFNNNNNNNNLSLRSCFNSCSAIVGCIQPAEQWALSSNHKMLTLFNLKVISRLPNVESVDRTTSMSLHSSPIVFLPKKMYTFHNWSVINNNNSNNISNNHFS